MPEPLWTPSPRRIADSQMMRYLAFLRKTRSLDFSDFDDVYAWSVDDITDFWASLWEFSGLIHSQTYTTILAGREMIDAQWFTGARLNFAENLLRYRDDRPAIVYVDESGVRERLTFRELHARVAACSAGLRRLGVVKGDRVAGYITNRPEAVIAMLAVTAIGAIWSSCSPDFGFTGVFDRFGQIAPKVLFAIDTYEYHGRTHTTRDRVEHLKRDIPAIEHVVLVGDIDDDTRLPEGFMTFDALASDTEAALSFEQLPFDHPVYIMYSSGTTGLPKCMVHGAGGTLLQHYKEHVLHTDMTRDDVITYFTTCGWMMWNWLVSSLQIGATVLLYDGSPAWPDHDVLWQLIDGEHISVFGTSPKFLSACQNEGLRPRVTHRLDSLKAILSTGSPLSGENFTWVYRDVKADLQLASISGGTDIISCFLLGCPVRPVYSGEIQCRGLGMKVETYDDAGRPVQNRVGELVCTRPFVSMPVYFWNDPDRAKYRSAYFEHFPGVWRHGDYITITPRDGIIVYGRSDATLNRAGVRIGTAEIYAPVEALDEIDDSLVVAQQRGDDIRIILFVVPAAGVTLTDELRAKIARVIRQQQSPRHVPDLILTIREVPHTLNGKKVEMAVTAVIHGREVTNRDALANPEVLEQFRDIPELNG